MVRYYKSRFLTEPVIYLQNPDSWTSYAPGGVIRTALGEIPEDIIKFVTEIPQEEGDAWIAYRLDDADRIERQRPQGADTSALAGRRSTGIGGYLIFVIIWIGLTMSGVLNVMRDASDRLSQDVTGAMTGASLGRYEAGWMAVNIVDIVFPLALLGSGILIFVFVGKRKRSTRWLMAGFCGLAILFAVFNLVMAVTFGLDSLRSAGFSDLADDLVGEQVASMVGAVIGLLMILPYVLTSERVREVFDGRKVATPFTPIQGAGQAPMPGPWTPPPYPGPAGSAWPSAEPPRWEPVVPDRFCPACGAEHPPDTRFCMRCGREFGAA